MSAKQLLRKNVKNSLLRVSQQEIELQSKEITNVLIPLLKTCQNIGCYLSMEDSEVDTQYLLQHLLSQGKTVFLPRCTSTRDSGQVSLRDATLHHQHLTFHRMASWQQIQSLKPQGKYQLREPCKEHPAPLPAALDVMLVPGVAFSFDKGARLGHGAGYYDDYFNRYQLQHNGTKPLLIGLALKEQILNKIPVESHDRNMDCIVCGDGTVHWISPIAHSILERIS